MADIKRVFMIVLDSVGIGAAPDAEAFGDVPDCNTLRRISMDPAFRCETVRRLGMGYMQGVTWMGTYGPSPSTVYRLMEKSRGKDTTTGHWELAGVVSERPMPTYPDGFPEEILSAFRAATGRGVLCNKPYSGTEVIRDYGKQHMETGDLIVYTSADSVFQIAAHEDVVPVEQLYEYCRMAREILQGEHGVGRVIARPFVGEYPHFTRTANRRDFSLTPPRPTMLDAIKEAGMDVIGVGKISDIFAGQGITRSIHTHSNTEGMEVTAQLAGEDFHGLCFVNLVDFDSVYGHRNDISGYAKAFAEFDAWLAAFLPLLGEDDALIITADHGCDPGDGESTDHTREYVPFLLHSKRITPTVGLNRPFSDAAAIVCDLLGVSYQWDGALVRERPMFPPVTDEKLLECAETAMENAYAPYSGYKVGAALLDESGQIYRGCNVENASYGATICAERTAFMHWAQIGAAMRGHKPLAIAIVGGKDGVITDFAPPCGICRQVMMEFCDPDTFRILLTNGKEVRTYTLSQLLPLGFGPSKLD